MSENRRVSAVRLKWLLDWAKSSDIQDMLRSELAHDFVAAIRELQELRRAEVYEEMLKRIERK